MLNYTIIEGKIASIDKKSGTIVINSEGENQSHIVFLKDWFWEKKEIKAGKSIIVEGQWATEKDKNGNKYKKLLANNISEHINKAILLGRLGSDPDLKYLPDGTPVCEFSLATHIFNGEKKTEWEKVVAFRKNAENCVEYLKKGGLILVIGYTKLQIWEDKEDGNERKANKTIASIIKFISSP